MLKWLDELKKLEAAATSGPWGDLITTEVGVGDDVIWKSAELKANEDLLVAARNSLPKLIAIAEAAENLVEGVSCVSCPICGTYELRLHNPYCPVVKLYEALK